MPDFQEALGTVPWMTLPNKHTAGSKNKNKPPTAVTAILQPVHLWVNSDCEQPLWKGDNVDSHSEAAPPPTAKMATQNSHEVREWQHRPAARVSTWLPKTGILGTTLPITLNKLQFLE